MTDALAESQEPSQLGRSALSLLRRNQPSRSANEYVAETLRQAMLDGTLPGGTRLLQAEIAKVLDVSTTPVREALRDLAAEGLITFQPQRGATVRMLRMDEVQEIYELRIVLEPIALRRTVRTLRAQVVDKAQKLLVQMDREPDTAAWSRLNHDFHALFMDTGEPTRLSDILAELRDAASVYVALSLKSEPEQLARSTLEHWAFIKACRQRDLDEAINITTGHLRSTLSVIENANGLPLAEGRPGAGREAQRQSRLK